MQQTFNPLLLSLLLLIQIANRMNLGTFQEEIARDYPLLLYRFVGCLCFTVPKVHFKKLEKSNVGKKRRLIDAELMNKLFSSQNSIVAKLAVVDCLGTKVSRFRITILCCCSFRSRALQNPKSLVVSTGSDMMAISSEEPDPRTK